MQKLLPNVQAYKFWRFSCERLPTQMFSAELSHIENMEMKALITTIQLSPYMTPVQISMECDELKGDMTLQLPVQQDASRVARHFKR